jgi:alpha-L-fucosidase
MLLRHRVLPEWFEQPQLGIFIHWTMASVPAFAPLSDDPFTMADKHGWAHAMANTPYVEWYQNSLAIPGSPVATFHKSTYGDKPYADFASQWMSAHQQWTPDSWVDLFAEAGATYIVLVTKHHDGFCLWPTEVTHPHLPRWSHDRDLVGDLAAAVRRRGMRFGVYYSGGLDWTFRGPDNGYAITDFAAMMRAVPNDKLYLDYANAHWHELIDRYQPDVLWNDIHWPADPTPIFEYLYAQVPDAVVNDRFDVRGVQKGTTHADFVTPEYRARPQAGAAVTKFEVCRGIGRSFGYNASEDEADYLPVADLRALRDDVFAARGNLLLNVGPTAAGEIPEAQALRVRALG